MTEATGDGCFPANAGRAAGLAEGGGFTLFALTAGTVSLAGDVLATALFVSGWRTGVVDAAGVKVVRGAFISLFVPFCSETGFMPDFADGELAACILSGSGLTVGA